MRPSRAAAAAWREVEASCSKLYDLASEVGCSTLLKAWTTLPSDFSKVGRAGMAYMARLHLLMTCTSSAGDNHVRLPCASCSLPGLLSQLAMLMACKPASVSPLADHWQLPC